jgi:hypothetical protein
MPGVLLKFLQLSPRERLLLTEAAARLAIAGILLRMVPFGRLTRSLSPRGERSMTPAEIRDIRWAVESVAGRFPRLLPCLPRGFAAAWMLLARGAAPRMHYGVAYGGLCFEAHVWVELGGVPGVGHRQAARFTVLTSFPS